MERISMLEIDKECEALKKRVKDILGVNIVIIKSRLYTLSFEDKDEHINEDIETLSIYKNTRVSKFLLQSKIYDAVVYSINYYETRASDVIIKLKSSELILMSDEEYKLGIYGTGFLYFAIQWRKCTDINVTNHQPIFEVVHELYYHSRIKTQEEYIETIFNQSKTQKGYIDEMLICLK